MDNLGNVFENVLESHNAPWSLKRLNCIYESRFFPALVAFVVIFIELLIVKPYYLLDGESVNYNSTLVASVICATIVYTVPFFLNK
jgi:hypothetical protein